MRPMRSLSSTIGRTRSERAVKKATLGFMVLGFAFCLISFLVMAADRNKGWALDSFHRYVELSQKGVTGTFGCYRGTLIKMLLYTEEEHINAFELPSCRSSSLNLANFMTSSISLLNVVFALWLLQNRFGYWDVFRSHLWELTFKIAHISEF